MDAKELYEQALKAKTAFQELEFQAREMRRQWSELDRLMSAAVAFERYGLKPGDVVDVHEVGPHKRAHQFRMKITHFSAHSPDDETPSIHGVNIRKDGSVGEQRKYTYPGLDEVTLTKVEQAPGGGVGEGE